jgi:hypothetical protein
MYLVFVIRDPFAPPETSGINPVEIPPVYVPLFEHPEISNADVPDNSSNVQNPIG